MKLTIHKCVVNVIPVTNPTQCTKLGKQIVKSIFYYKYWEFRVRRFRVFSEKHALFKASDIPKSYNICGRRKNAEKKSRILQLYHLLDSKSKKHIGIRGSQGYTHMVSGPSGGHVWGPQWFPDGLGSVYLW